MTRILHDRYIRCGRDLACDLVTGEQVALGEIAPEAGAHGDPSMALLTELLENGRDGEPRWVVAGARSDAHAATIRKRAAATARHSGFVALSVGASVRWRREIGDELRERAMLLLGSRGDRAAAGAALVWAADISPRPHLLLTFRSMSSSTLAPMVREARMAYGIPAAPAGQSVLSRDAGKHLERAARAREFMRAGRHAAAERLLLDVAGALERRRSSEAAAAVRLRLATFLLERGRTRDGVRQCDEAVRLAGPDTASPVCLEARTWQAWARIDLGELTHAEALLRAILLVAEKNASRTWAAVTLARCLLAQKRVGELPDTVPDLDLIGLPATPTAMAYETLVRVALARGDHFQAGQLARRALDAVIGCADALAVVVAQTAQLRLLCAAGDLTPAGTTFAQLLRLARGAHSPLRAAQARLVWVEALHRAGRVSEARRELACLRRVERLAPPLLQRAIAAVVRRPATQDEVNSRVVRHETPVPLAADLVHAAQAEDDDREAMRSVLERVTRELIASRAEVVSAAAGPPTAILTTGGGRPTSLGVRVVESGLAIGFDGERGEAAVPVRLGTQLLGALTVRWPIDRAIPACARMVMEVAAAVLASRVDSLLLKARERAETSTSVPELIGTSSPIDEVRNAVGRAARAPFAVLIEGESGTGKELVARAIHYLGPRRDRRFCDVNCAALPDELLESELFGHVRGAFTGALVDRPGLFEEADGGTLFMDEIADLSLRAQAKLLRVVQQQQVRRVGEMFSRSVDVRLVAAANRDMHEEVAAGRFRQDLLYRLDVIRIRMPPLRERPGDVSILARHFWALAAARVGTQASLTPAVMADLARYQWPGNVRELQNVISALAVAAPSRGRVKSALLPAVIGAATSVSSPRLEEARQQFERRFIEAALAKAGGSRTRAASALGLSRQGLLKMMVRHRRDAAAR